MTTYNTVSFAIAMHSKSEDDETVCRLCGVKFSKDVLKALTKAKNVDGYTSLDACPTSVKEFETLYKSLQFHASGHNHSPQWDACPRQTSKIFLELCVAEPAWTDAEMIAVEMLRQQTFSGDFDYKNFQSWITPVPGQSLETCLCKYVHWRTAEASGRIHRSNMKNLLEDIAKAKAKATATAKAKGKTKGKRTAKDGQANSNDNGPAEAQDEAKSNKRRGVKRKQSNDVSGNDEAKAKGNETKLTSNEMRKEVSAFLKCRGDDMEAQIHANIQQIRDQSTERTYHMIQDRLLSLKKGCDPQTKQDAPFSPFKVSPPTPPFMPVSFSPLSFVPV
jgi:hypothetical protein